MAEFIIASLLQATGENFQKIPNRNYLYAILVPKCAFALIHQNSAFYPLKLLDGT
jgi:hypothetical protein